MILVLIQRPSGIMGGREIGWRRLRRRPEVERQSVPVTESGAEAGSVARLTE
jgi:hypothetical protein